MKLARYFLFFLVPFLAMLAGAQTRQEGVVRDASAQALGMQAQPSPRPVVMVHGFSSNWQAWANYLGPDGYLAQAGIQGFAVGDGQVPGEMNTGRLDQPTGRTNTIAENAAILGEYIASVKEKTGAQQVDLLAHSMGGLISRYYIARLMPEGEVAQLLMLGSPMAGTECAILPSALGYYLPAVLEIRPSYVEGIFNQQITERGAAQFHALAGIPIIKSLQSPCTPVPTDIAVSYRSVSAIPLELATIQVLHHELNTSERVFKEFVLPRLQNPGTEGVQETPPAAEDSAQQQFSQVFSGSLQAGESRELVIPIEPGVTVAKFALYDSSRSLTTEVRGASGNVIELSVEANGLVTVEDPQTLFYLGYGFENPKAGEWRVTLQTTEDTPAAGAEYALSAVFEGGARLQAQTSTLLPAIGELVEITAELQGSELELAGIQAAEAQVLGPDGSRESAALVAQGESLRWEWRAQKPGLHGVELLVRAAAADGSEIRRSAFLTVDVQPDREPNLLFLALLAAGAVLALVLGLRAVLARRSKSFSR